jgi:hypothetical protein
MTRLSAVTRGPVRAADPPLDLFSPKFINLNAMLRNVFQGQRLEPEINETKISRHT